MKKLVIIVKNIWKVSNGINKLTKNKLSEYTIAKIKINKKQTIWIHNSKNKKIKKRKRIINKRRTSANQFFNHLLQEFNILICLFNLFH